MTTKTTDEFMQAVPKQEEVSSSPSVELQIPLAASTPQFSERVAWFAVIVAGLGYFVDVFDLWLFSNFRVKSLTSLGLSPTDVTIVGVRLINYQLAGMVVGGFAWGILGDKKGRAKVMFGSILLYSVATILNAFVTTVEQYEVLRFLAGLGLAGEIGAGITLIAELLPKAKRGLGTTFVTCLGVSGAIFAALAGRYLDWRTAYILGGVMGLSLLFLRFMVHESGIYSQMKEESAGLKAGSLKLLFGNPKRCIRFVSCILVGVPLYLTFGLFAAFSPEIALGIGIVQPLTVADVMLYASVGITAGDLLAGLVSQKLQSRKIPIFMLLLIGGLLSIALTLGLPKSAFQYQALVGLIGISTGYWACLITTSAENFGTNLRATVTTSVPNIVRGSGIILTSSFLFLKSSYTVSESLLYITIVSYFLALGGLFLLKETFHEDMDFYER